MSSQLLSLTIVALHERELHVKMSTSWHRAHVPTLTVWPSLCPNCCCRPCATVSSAADWGSSPDPCLWRTDREKASWRGVPLAARDCENDLHFHGDSCHACGRDPAAHTEWKHKDLVQSGNLKQAENSSFTGLSQWYSQTPGPSSDERCFSDLRRITNLFGAARGWATLPH